MNHEEVFEDRNEQLRHTIDVLARYDPAELDAHGRKSQIMEKHDLDANRVYYVLDQWNELVDWRRNANADPLDPEAVRAAYDDEELAALATAADGAGNVTVTIDVRLDEAFRMMKLLPVDLGLTVFQQTMAEAGDIPPEVIRGVTE